MACESEAHLPSPPSSRMMQMMLPSAINARSFSFGPSSEWGTSVPKRIVLKKFQAYPPSTDLYATTPHSRMTDMTKLPSDGSRTYPRPSVRKFFAGCGNPLNVINVSLVSTTKVPKVTIVWCRPRVLKQLNLTISVVSPQAFF